ncbi:hypothetical protein HI914_05428 [Erysiphe necator]|nr:hypothetical protein HI914_05428 [Erysiphe necator]
MQLKNFALILGFLISSFLGRAQEEDFKIVQPNKKIDCKFRTFSSEELISAAYQACSQYCRQVKCREYRLCSLSIMVSPEKVPTYDGHLFQDSREVPLLKWPIPSTSLWDLRSYYAIINYLPSSKTCKVIGAISSSEILNLGQVNKCDNKSI